VLVAGLILAAALAIGGVWIVRAGVALATVTAVVSVVLAWREARLERKARARDELEAVRAQGMELSRERRANIAVVNSLESRNKAIAARITDLTAEIRVLREELITVRKVNSGLTEEVADRDETIVELRTDLAHAEEELRALLGSRAEVVTMPRRGTVAVVSSDQWAALPTAEELWSDGDHPTVVDLKALSGQDLERLERKHA